MPFEVRAERGDRELRLALVGELDLGTAPELVRRIRRLDDDPPQTLVLDFDALEFIDVAGLRTVLTAARWAEARGIRLLVARPRDHVRRLLELTAIDKSLELAAA